ncbi:hypothetical protein E4191_22005 (plasmid) [Paracoccus liaowanqingii]|uniref:Peptidase M10 serralysin C-terminal domain-containing protein n=1 Tax=Paracoccus liaowanqingii TaxID=2560053 RepID=A0A4Y5SV61_9RHOB|nr:hypothetical protein [Paracoccus liaowanqingii]QDA36748.1 hypothetical protein E4191_22005 [Paracoccus liaowanqingii]
MPTIDGSIQDWSPAARLDRPQTGTAGYGLWGIADPQYLYIAMTAEDVAIGANSTVWLDTDLNRSTGHLIWGWAGGAEYHVEIAADGSARLYSGGPQQVLVADLEAARSADGRVVEFRIDRALIGTPAGPVRVYADVNDTAYLPASYATGNLQIAAPVPVEAGGKVLDGNLAEWAGATRLDTPATGAAGYALHGDLQGGVYTFAIATDGLEIGAGTTIWLDTDRDGTTGHRLWGWAVGGEYNINIGADGRARLYTGAAGETFVADLDFALNAAGTAIEIAVDQALLGNPASLRVFADVNDAVFIPNSYATAEFIVGTPPPVTVGAITLDGALADWGSEGLLVTQAGHQLRGQMQGDQFVFAIGTDGPAIGAGTTIWLDTDLDRATGHQIWGWAGGAEYNINIGADGQARLYSGAAGQTFVADLQFGLNAARTGFEVALDPALLTGDPAQIRVLADVNDAVFLPGDYGSANLVVGTAPVVDPVDSPESRIAIVYSATTAANFYDLTAYGQLFMSAQNQAMQAGVPFDLLTEADLLDPAALARYDAIVFPGMSHVQAGQAGAIAASLATAVQDYGLGLIAAGNFLTNDQTGAALPGNSYARMNALLGVTLEGFGATQGIRLRATDADSPVLNGYGAGQVVGNYGNVSYLNFTDTTGQGQVLFEQVVTGAVHDAVIATQTGGRNVHFATDAIMGNANILGQAIDWVLQDNAPDVSLLLTRHSSLFYARNDMDQSQEVWDVSIREPGIYDAMLPIIEDWYADHGFVGSYYINVGANAPDQQTDWAVSRPYYERILALESEIGSHYYTHPHDTNQLFPDRITQAQLDANRLVPPILSQLDAAAFNAILADTLARTDPRNPAAIDPTQLTDVERAVLDFSYRFQFEYSKLVIERELGITVAGAAVPGAPERLDATREMIGFFDYLSGGYSGVGAGYPGAFGYLTPGEDDRVYLAPNMSFDFSLIGWYDMTPAEAEAAWLQEFATLTANATTPILAFPWHDYGPTNWFEDPDQTYSRQMFDTLIATAAASGTEFVTGEDLARRIDSFADSTLTVTRTGNVVSTTVGSTDAGHFALDLGSEGRIASVANWYAYDQDSVFLPRAGGSFDVTLGAQMADVTRISALPMRGELLSVSGDGRDLQFSFVGRGEVEVDLRTQGGAPIRITGADGASLPEPGTVALSFDAVGQHAAVVDFLNPGARLNGGTGTDILLGGSRADRFDPRGGDDVMAGGGGADLFIFRRNNAFDTILDFTTGSDRVQLWNFGLANATAALNAFTATAEGLEFRYGARDRLLLAGLDEGDLTAADIVIQSTILG